MKNPFRYGEVVEETSFCNREEELKEIKTAIKNRYSFMKEFIDTTTLSLKNG